MNMHTERRGRRRGIMMKFIISCSLFLILLGHSNFVLASHQEQRRQQQPTRTTNASSTTRHLRRKTEEEATSTVWDRIQRNNDLSTFATAITVAEMEDTFTTTNEDSQPITVVFAPTNEAFEKLGKEYVDKLLIDPTFSLHLNYFLRNHATSSTNDYLTTTSSSITTLSAETTYVQVIDDDAEKDQEVVLLHTYASQREYTDPVQLLVSDADDEDAATMTAANNNGVALYEVNTALAPVWYYQDIMDVLSSNNYGGDDGDKYSTLRELIVDADLEENVKSLSGSTFIAPTNDAFHDLSTSIMNNKDALKDVLLYHILPDVVINAGVLGVSKTPIPTAAGHGKEEEVMVGIARGENNLAEFSFNSAKSDGIYLSKDNIIYSVDSVLIPPDLVVVVQQSTDTDNTENETNEDTTTDEVPADDESQPGADVDSSPKEEEEEEAEEETSVIIPRQPDDNNMPALAADRSSANDNNYVPVSPAAPAFDSDSGTNSTGTPSTACNIRADIKCYTSTGVKCGEIPNPMGITCNGDDRPHSISFRYTGGHCNDAGKKYNCEDYLNADGIDESEVYVEVHSDSLSIYKGIVQEDEIFEADGKYKKGDTAIIHIYTVARDGDDNTIIGLLLSQTVTIPTRCEDLSGDLELGAQYGALNLVGFSNDAGSPTTDTPITISYIVVNEGLRTAILNSSLIRSSSFEEEEPIEALIEPLNLPPTADDSITEYVEVYNQPVSLDRMYWSGDDREMYFNITAYGHDEVYGTGNKCMAGAALYM